MERQQVYSFRKYKGLGLASVAILSMLLANQSLVVQADEVVDRERTEHITSSQESEEQVTSTEGQTAENEQSAQEIPEPSAPTLATSATQTALEISLRQSAGASQTVTEGLDEVLTELTETYGAAAHYDQLTSEEKARYEAAIYHDYTHHLVEKVFPELQPATTYQQLPTREGLALFTKFVVEERRNPIHQGNAQLAAEAARQRAVAAYNETLLEEPTVTAYSQQEPEMVKALIQTAVSGQGLSRLEAEQGNFFAGLYALSSQYQFEEDLPSLLISQDARVMASGQTTHPDALGHLLAVGRETKALVRNKTDLGNLLGQSQTLFERAIAPLTGFTSPLALIEQLAQTKGQTVGDYVLGQSEASIQLSHLVDKEQVPAWLQTNTKLLLPILAQGEGLLVGITRDSVAVGLVDVYRTESELPQLTSSNRGQTQTVERQLVDVLDDFEHFNTFLRDASRYGQDDTERSAKPSVFRDTLILSNAQGQRQWQTKATHATVRQFFAPLGMDSPSYVVSQNLGGQSESEQSIVSFGVKVFGKDKQGVTLYSHEMTHSNDERLLFDGSYQGTSRQPTILANRRQGQGPELYARGLFEALDNSQTATSITRPAFNLNTALTIPSGQGNDHVDQIQPSQPLDTAEALAAYQHKLIKLIMWMEAKEAQVALALPEAERRLYFNQVEQLPRTGANADQTSTNDHFIASRTAPANLADLVNGSYVTAGYVANGTQRFGLVETNGYNIVPLLDSFYGANFAPIGGNTVGDISFKRNAHEVLGWHGFETMLDYISGRSRSDQEFLEKLQSRQANKTSTLEGKVENTAQATKLKQYESLLALELTDVPEHLKQLYTSETLERAIAADLAVLRAANGNDQVIYNQLTNVRRLKQSLLASLIEETDRMDSDPGKQILGTPRLAPVEHTVHYRFTFEGNNAAQFDETVVPLPADQLIPSGGHLQPPVYPELIVSKDLSGEWQFKGWEPAHQNPITQDLSLTGTWLYRAYLPIVAERVYIADEHQTVGTPHRTIQAGQTGKRSAFTNEVVQAPQAEQIAVGTKPREDRQETVLPPIYEADETRLVGSPMVIKTAGTPRVTVTRTTFRIDNGQAVEDETSTETLSEGRPEIITVGTKLRLIDYTEDVKYFPTRPEVTTNNELINDHLSIELAVAFAVSDSIPYLTPTTPQNFNNRGEQLLHSKGKFMDELSVNPKNEPIDLFLSNQAVAQSGSALLPKTGERSSLLLVSGLAILTVFLSFISRYYLIKRE